MAKQNDSDVVVQEGRTIAVTASDKLRKYLDMRADQYVPDEAGSDLTDEQIEKMMAAAESGDMDAIMAADQGGTIAGKSYCDQPIEIHSYDVLKSTLDTVLGYYILIRATNLNSGADVVINTSSPLVIAKLRALEAASGKDLGESLGLRVMLNNTTTRSGNDFVRMVAAPAMYLQAVTQ
jgi:hypothetical protein